MDSVLFGFCLVSISITVCLVLLELGRNGRAKIRIPETELSELPEVESEFREGTDAEERTSWQGVDQADFLRQRIEEALRRQLVQMGYDREEEQLDFISELLKSEKKSLSSLNPNELRRLLNGIIVKQEPAEGKGLQQNA